jgi:hypothetical protein
MGELLVALDDGAWKTMYLQLRDYKQAEGHVSLAEDDKHIALSEWVRAAVRSGPLSLWLSRSPAQNSTLSPDALGQRVRRRLLRCRAPPGLYRLSLPRHPHLLLWLARSLARLPAR